MEFQFPTHEIAEADREILRQRFESDWHIKSIFIQKDAFFFERKIEL